MGDKVENIKAQEIFTMNNVYTQKAKEYIHSILYGVESFERHGQRPVIVMSMDIFDVLVAFTQNVMKYISANEITCCGRDVKIAMGKNVLLVACDLLKI